MQILRYCEQFESLIRRDPAGRGLTAWQGKQGPLATGQLRRAAEHLALSATRVAMVTGFVSLDGDRAVVESDGPPGALYLARALQQLGIPTVLVSDSYGVPALGAGCDHLGLTPSAVLEFPFNENPSARASNAPEHNETADDWVQRFLNGPLADGLSHLIAIERPGPSHTEESVKAGCLGSSKASPQRIQEGCLGSSEASPQQTPLEQFRRAVTPEQQNVCYSMRGRKITRHVAKTHRLFELAAQRSITTIGIGDGGNEIGMGSIPWELLRQAILLGPRDRLPCRIATDFTLLAGVSNWAAYALALATAAARGQLEIAATWTVQRERMLLQHLSREAGVVDGITLRREPTVDGLPTETYLEILTGLREILGLK